MFGQRNEAFVEGDPYSACGKALEVLSANGHEGSRKSEGRNGETHVDEGTDRKVIKKL